MRMRAKAGRAAWAFAALYAILASGCARRGGAGAGNADSFRIPLDDGPKAFVFGSAGGGPLLSPLAGGSPMEAPARREAWTAAVHARGFARVGDRLVCFVNGVGVAWFAASADGGLTALVSRDLESFGGRTVTAVWTDGIRAYAFLAANDAFGPAAASSRLVSIAPGEAAFRDEPFPFADAYPPPWKVVSAHPAPPESIRYQLIREPAEGEDSAEEAYVETSGSGSWKKISSAAYLSAWNPASADRAPAAAIGLAEPAPILARYGRAEGEAFLALNLRKAPFFSLDCYALSGDPGALFTADAWAWVDAGIAIAAYPDGTLRFRNEDRAGIVKSARLPALPASLDYGECAALGNVAFAAWAESVYPDTLRAGITVSRIY